MRAPKNPKDNLIYRQEIIKAAVSSRQVKQEVWIASKRSFEWFCDTMLWTFANKDHPDVPDRPFILWPYQVECAEKIAGAIGKHDLLIEKSRDMGATWLIEAVLFWRWMFYRKQSFLMGSRKEEYVEKRGDPKSLFYKMDYFIDTLPQWMVPAHNRTDKHLANEENGSTIDGESTNSNMGRGDRRQAVFLDEFAFVEEVVSGHAVLSAIRDTSRCRIFASTSAGTGGAFYDMRTQMLAETPERIVTLHWTRHPLKAAGLHYVDGKPTSPWYEEEKRRAAHPTEIARELDIAYDQAGGQFFDKSSIDTLILKNARDPVVEGDIEYGETFDTKFRKMDKGPLKLWLNLGANGRPPEMEYVIGADVSMGRSGEYSSQSVLSIGEKTTGRKVAMFTSSDIDEPEFGRLAAAMCRWFYNAKLIWEAQGPGGPFGKAVLNSGYRNIFVRQDEKSLGRKIRDVAGWWSGPEEKYLLFCAYREALDKGTFINPSKEALLETLQYIIKGRRIDHARALATTDPMATGDLHGDMVIADALCNKLLTPEAKVVHTKRDQDCPIGSLKWRMEVQKRMERSKPLY